MYCRCCGKELPETAELCVQCGSKPLAGNKYCQNCGAETDQKAEVCIKCGVRLTKAKVISEGQKDWLTALLLSIFLGYLGVDRFYLGYIGLGILKLFISLVTLGFAAWIWWIIDIILIATGRLKDAEGRELYKK